MRGRSRITPSEFRQALRSLGLSQERFADTASISRRSVNRACCAKECISVAMANSLRLAQVTLALRAIVAARHARPGWHRMKAVLAIAETPVKLIKRKRGRHGARYRPRQPKAVVPAAALETPPPQTTVLPTLNNPGPAPAGFSWMLFNRTWMLRADKPRYEGTI
jgi:hypothetical protein